MYNKIVWRRYYLSPELCADMPYRDKSDCWAFGVLIFEVLYMFFFFFAFAIATVSGLILAVYVIHCNFVQCATLQHPFEARNQCALILKIIEANVKCPPTSVMSAELRNVVMWLLQKDPNLRPSIKDMLNEVLPGSFFYLLTIFHTTNIFTFYKYFAYVFILLIFCIREFSELSARSYKNMATIFRRSCKVPR
jgi:serine/threonine protein kinase